MKIFKLVFLGMVSLLALAGFAKAERVIPASTNEQTSTIYSGSPITIRFSTHAPATHPACQFMIGSWEKYLHEKSHGKLSVKKYYSGSLHGAKQSFTAARTGVTDVTIGFPSYEPSGLHMVFAMELPFAAHSALDYRFLINIAT